MNIKNILAAAVLLIVTGCSQQNASPSPTLPPPPTPSREIRPSETPEPQQPTPTEEEAGSDQAGLSAAWGPVINNAILIFSGCEWTFNTHSWYEMGEISLDQTKSKLESIADFLSFTIWDDPAAYQDPASAELMLELEEELGNLVGIVTNTPESEYGSLDVFDSLQVVCEKTMDLQSRVVDAAQEAGLTEESIADLDISRGEMYQDYSDLIWGGF